MVTCCPVCKSLVATTVWVLVLGARVDDHGFDKVKEVGPEQSVQTAIDSAKVASGHVYDATVSAVSTEVPDAANSVAAKTASVVNAPSVAKKGAEALKKLLSNSEESSDHSVDAAVAASEIAESDAAVDAEAMLKKVEDKQKILEAEAAAPVKSARDEALESFVAESNAGEQSVDAAVAVSQKAESDAAKLQSLAMQAKAAVKKTNKKLKATDAATEEIVRKESSVQAKAAADVKKDREKAALAKVQKDKFGAEAATAAEARMKAEAALSAAKKKKKRAAAEVGKKKAQADAGNELIHKERDTYEVAVASHDKAAMAAAQAAANKAKELTEDAGAAVTVAEAEEAAANADIKRASLEAAKRSCLERDAKTACAKLSSESEAALKKAEEEENIEEEAKRKALEAEAAASVKSAHDEVAMAKKNVQKEVMSSATAQRKVAEASAALLAARTKRNEAAQVAERKLETDNAALEAQEQEEAARAAVAATAAARRAEEEQAKASQLTAAAVRARLLAEGMFSDADSNKVKSVASDAPTNAPGSRLQKVNAALAELSGDGADADENHDDHADGGEVSDLARSLQAERDIESSMKAMTSSEHAQVEDMRQDANKIQVELESVHKLMADMRSLGKFGA